MRRGGKEAYGIWVKCNSASYTSLLCCIYLKQKNAKDDVFCK